MPSPQRPSPPQPPSQTPQAPSPPADGAAPPERMTKLPPDLGPNVVLLRTVVSSTGPWIFRKMVREPSPRTEPGAVVKVLDREGTFVAWAFWNPRSEIALRVLTRDPAPCDERWLRRAVRDAVSLRRDTLQLDRVTNGWRAVFSEADHLPGLIVDRYGDVLSCQVSTLGAYRAFPVLADELKKAFHARVVHVQSDPKLAKLEGFPIPDSAGESARAVVQEHGLQFDVDCARGHKTGFFLDQRESRRKVRDLARGRNVLDLCSYTGGFAVNAAKGDAALVTAVDLDETAVAQAKRNAEKNSLSAKVNFVHADVFPFLRGLRGGEHDLIVCDPAKQAQRKEERDKALRAYHDLNALVFEKAADGALVLTCSCTGVVSEHDFLATLARAAASARRNVTFLEVRGAPADHGVPSDFPQARYLKNVLCRVTR
ncbi:MAG: Ribosomal RNA large subunit methyltransferase I [Planctomycetes bacterium]|nr:Ribosomal RNA large subunit methyltransferase I [Planctomycetota bacterium]